MGILIPGGAAAQARRWGVWGTGVAWRLMWPSITPISTGGQSILSHFAKSFRHARSPRTVYGQHIRSIPHDPAHCKTEIGMFNIKSPTDKMA